MEARSQKSIGFDINGTLSNSHRASEEFARFLLKMSHFVNMKTFVISGSDEDEIKEFVEATRLGDFVSSIKTKMDIKPQEFDWVVDDDETFAAIMGKEGGISVRDEKIKVFKRGSIKPLVQFSIKDTGGVVEAITEFIFDSNYKLNIKLERQNK